MAPIASRTAIVAAVTTQKMPSLAMNATKAKRRRNPAR